MADPSVIQALKLAVERDPDASQRTILDGLRRDGLKISNISGREIINQEKKRLQRQLEQNVIDPINKRFGNFREFTYIEGDIKGFAENRIDQILRENIKNREVFVKEPGRKEVRLSTFRYVKVSFKVSANVSIFLEGRKFGEERIDFDGEFTTEVTAFTEELLSERIRQQVEGRISISTGEKLGLAGNSVIQGLTVDVENMDIDLTRLVPRG